MDPDVSFCEVCGTNHIEGQSCPEWAQAVVIAPTCERKL